MQTLTLLPTAEVGNQQNEYCSKTADKQRTKEKKLLSVAKHSFASEIAKHEIVKVSAFFFRSRFFSFIEQITDWKNLICIRSRKFRVRFTIFRWRPSRGSNAKYLLFTSQLSHGTKEKNTKTKQKSDRLHFKQWHRNNESTRERKTK